jgi:hypothetical protein
VTLAPAETAARLANARDVLREAVHVTAGRLPLEPRFEVKAILAAHLHDDAQAVATLRRRIEELGGAARGPGEELARLLDRDVYAALKPALISALNAHRRRLDPLADEPTLHLLTHLVHRQERHLAELPTAPEPDLPDDLGSLPRDPDSERRLVPLPPLDRPARDSFVRVVDDPPDQHEAHALMDGKLCAAELLARTSHEHPDMPDEFHIDLARAARDATRHAELLDRHMSAELGLHWGAFPVSLSGFRDLYARDLAGRLQALDGTSTAYAPGSPVFEHMRADDAARSHLTRRWQSA